MIMKTTFDNIFVSKFEYNYFAQLDSVDQLNYFFDMYAAYNFYKKEFGSF
jgi:hypothetical protein